jgi:hypothetical protein
MSNLRVVTSMKYAIINVEGLVVNAIEWDDATLWNPPAEHMALPLLDGGIGWTFADGQFIPPSEPETLE